MLKKHILGWQILLPYNSHSNRTSYTHEYMLLILQQNVTIRNEPSIHIKSNSGIKMSNFLARQKFVSFLKYTYYLYVQKFFYYAL